MTAIEKCCKCYPFFIGIIFISLGTYLCIEQPITDFIIRNVIQKEMELVKGRLGFEILWKELDIHVHIWIFDVLNPDEIMEGATPNLRERGPYVYDVRTKRTILKIDEEADEMEYLSEKIYHFNRELSVGSEDDLITTINYAYTSSLETMQKGFPSYLKKLGNSMHKLFPDMEDIFVRATVGNMLFNGLPMECNATKYKELRIVCGILSGKQPTGVETTDVSGVYKWSYFNYLNRTSPDTMIVNRGIKNKSHLGDIVGWKGRRLQKLWVGDNCNKIAGSESLIWPSMNYRLDYVSIFETQVCRSVKIDYVRDEIVYGISGWRFELGNNFWNPNTTTCYCPLVKKKPVCPPMGLMDLTACKEAPVYFSEPHFLHADSSLVKFATGVNPDAKRHSTYLVIEPLSGAPIAGTKKSQINCKIINMPAVDFLANVSSGYFPVLWFEEVKEDVATDLIIKLVQVHRLLRLFHYLTHVPLVVGIFLVLKTIFLYGESESGIINVAINQTSLISVQSKLSNNPRIDETDNKSAARRSRIRPTQSFN